MTVLSFDPFLRHVQRVVSSLANAALIVLACTCAVAAGTSFGAEPQATTGAPGDSSVIHVAAYARPQRTVEIEKGRKLNLNCTGKGSPTVIFESGQGDDGSEWGFVQPLVAAQARACSYDRAGFGFSDAMTRPQNAANFVDDLHRLLAKAAVKPPYVLVGHSLGGMYVRLFAYVYPAEVAALVLVDPVNEDQQAGYRKIATHQKSDAEFALQLDEENTKRHECAAAASAGFAGDSPLQKQCVGEPDPHFSAAIRDALQKRRSRAEYFEADISERQNMFGTSADQLRAARHSFGDLPLILLSASPRAQSTNETDEHYAAAHRLQVALDRQLVALSTRGVYRAVPGSKHDIPLDKPQAVADAVLEMLEQARQR